MSHKAGGSRKKPESTARYNTIVNYCVSGKDAFESMQEASKAANILARKIDHRLKPYLCPKCSTYHLTSQTRRNKK